MKVAFNYILGTMLAGLMLVAFHGCKEKEIFVDDPYAGGKEALGITFVGDYAEPESGVPGSEVTFTIKGLKKWAGQFSFYLNESETEIRDFTDSTITVVVPELVSSGGASVRVNGQVFFGPRFEVEGSVKRDKNYDVVNGTNYQIADALPTADGMILVGGFTNYENLATNTDPINGIVAVNKLGKRASNYNFGKGVGGNVNSILKLANGQLMVAGSFSSYHNDAGILSLTRLHSDGKLDTTIVEVINLTPDKDANGLDTVPAFNGGVYGNIRKIVLQKNQQGEEKIVAVGNFSQYGRYNYTRATRDFKPVVVTQVRNVMRFELDGKIDSTYGINAATNTFWPAANGEILTAHLHPNEKLMVIGNFTTFQGKPANRIVRLTKDGNVDDTFNAGTGANDEISNIQYHEDSDTYMIVGQFTKYNGVDVGGVVRIHTDGSIDPTFKLRNLEGGGASFAKQLSSGKIVVAGTFDKYDAVVRRGFLLLESTGEALQKYNAVGTFNGVINHVEETLSSNGKPALILMGFIDKFNDEKVANLLKIEIED